MNRKHLLLTFFVMFFGLSLVLTSSFVAAQNADDGKQVKVKIQQNINGEMKTIEKTFSVDEEDDLEELLKDFDINLNEDDLDGKREVEISIRKTTKEGLEAEDNVVIDVQRVGGDFEAGEARGFLGVYTHGTTDKNGDPKGVVITEVIPGTAAEKAGLKKDDIILKVDDKDVSTADQFREVIRTYKPEDEVALLMQRDGKEETVKAVLKAPKMVREFHFMPNEEFEWKGRPPHVNFYDGSHIAQPRPFLGIVPGESDGKEGVIVGDVVEKSSAQEMGLQKGDRITKLNDKPVTDFGSLREALRTMKPDDEVKVEYQRDGKSATAAGKLGTKAAEKMCLHFDEGKMPGCAEKWMHQFDQEVTKENLQGELKELEREIQVLKKRIEVMDIEKEVQELKKEGTEETTISITIEDAVPGTLQVDNLQFSPNPNEGKFNISFDLQEKARTVIRIFDASNKEIYKEDLGKFSGRYTKQIDISENPKGIYFLQITQNDKAVNKKIVIQ